MSASAAAARTPRRASASRAASPLARGALATRLAAFERYFAASLESHASAARRLDQAIRYSALSPGKRLRPLLVLASAEAVGGDWRIALPAAAATECVHAFSLVHDDLPAMDDDDYRRGRLTTHRRFGEALGVLAGDALLAMAFDELVRLAERGVAAPRVLEAVRVLAWASGAEALVAGQALDIAAEGRRVSRADVAAIHERKTGALIGAAMALGALAGGAASARVEAFGAAGMKLGLAFQIHDDLLNAGSSLARLGKRSGTDAARGKATFPRAVGVERSIVEAAALLADVRRTVRAQAARPRVLLSLIDAVARRDR
ncbi:MAG: polyprenyl synthetase family protein [Candidatus Eisenbacteria bacterium]